jgi:hypothetical protein
MLVVIKIVLEENVSRDSDAVIMEYLSVTSSVVCNLFFTIFLFILRKDKLVMPSLPCESKLII